ncbi:MAG: hypothetical protein ACE5Z5_08585 [Candidatus Bathyarchaeia archaeon]
MRVEFHPISVLREPFRHDDALAWSRAKVVHIYLNPELPTELAEVLAAHELTHEALTAEGYPVTALNKAFVRDAAWQDVRSRLVSSILNAVVGRRLEEYGFDLTPYHQRGVENLMRGLESVKPEDVTPDAMRYNALVYLDYHLNAIPEGVKLLAAFLKRVPSPQWQLAEGVVGIVEEEGYDMPPRCLRAMVRVRDYLGLRNYVFVVDPRTNVHH